MGTCVLGTPFSDSLLISPCVVSNKQSWHIFSARDCFFRQNRKLLWVIWAGRGSTIAQSRKMFYDCWGNWGCHCCKYKTCHRANYIIVHTIYIYALYLTIKGLVYNIMKATAKYPKIQLTSLFIACHWSVRASLHEWKELLYCNFSILTFNRLWISKYFWLARSSVISITSVGDHSCHVLQASRHCNI